MTEPIVNDEPNYGEAKQPAHVTPELRVFSAELFEGSAVDKEEFPEVVRLRRGHPVVAWIIIAVLVLLVPALRSMRSVAHEFAEAPGVPAAPQASQGDRLSLLVLTMQSKFFVGLNELQRSSDPTAGKSLIDQAGALNTGPLDNRLCFAVLAGELEDFQAAQQILEELNAKVAGSERIQNDNVLRAKDALVRLYGDYAAGMLSGPSVGAEDRANLHANLGWFADLALAPRGGPNLEVRQALIGSAQTICIVIVVALVIGFLAGFVGFVGLCTLIGFYLVGNLKRGVSTGGGQGGIYAETFALWMIVFMVFSSAPLWIHVEGADMLVTGFGILASLIVLIWPVLRGGISWRQVREDIGLVAGRQPLLEPLLGPTGYAMSLPLLAVGVLMTLFLISVQTALQTGWGSVALGDDFGPSNFPAHPIIEFLAGPGWWGKLQVLFLGSIVAPIVEEIMFRGVLYRHMRESTSRWPFVLSFVASALVVSFVFAVIHPQGLVAVPALMSLAVGFTILREWRGSLISCMIAHGLNNAVIMSLATLVFSI
jgi:membrane protease YdiL (CAAX protease family)